MERIFRRLIRTAIVLIYLVILAGSIVRMTGSGMGCPDWPKCFGHLIPPTEMDQVIWKPNTEFKKGMMIVQGERLLVAQSDFRTSSEFSAENWAPYTRHDYAIFNAFHTWTEYINRLIGALAGLPILLIFLLSLGKIRVAPLNFLFALLALFFLGFEAWLGKYVVDGNLVPGHITIHMFGALVIVASLVVLLLRHSPKKKTAKVRLRWLLPLSLILLLIQIYLGTQVREEVDILDKAHTVARSGMLEVIGKKFTDHRSFSWAISIASLLFYAFNRQSPTARGLLGFTLFAVAVGAGLFYADLPKALQPVHIVWAALFFGWLFHRILLHYRSQE